MIILITECLGGYSVTINGDRTLKPSELLAKVAPHLNWTGKYESIRLPDRFQLELVKSTTINPYLKSTGKISLNSSSIVLAMHAFAELPTKLQNAQILSIGELLRSTENGMGYLSLMNGKISFSPLSAERKYPEKELFVVVNPNENGEVTPTVTTLDVFNDPNSG